MHIPSMLVRLSAPTPCCIDEFILSINLPVGNRCAVVRLKHFFVILFCFTYI